MGACHREVKCRVSGGDALPWCWAFRVVKRGGRKEMQMPEGAAQSRRTVNTLVKALARAFRWKRVLESGEFTTIAELAEHEGIAPARARDCLGDPGREAGPGGDGGEVARAICGVIGGATAVRRVIDAIGRLC